METAKNADQQHREKGNCDAVDCGHLAQPESFAKSSDCAGFTNQMQHEVCETHDLPHVQVPFGVDGHKLGFWHDNVAQHDLGNFFHAQGINSCLPA